MKLKDQLCNTKIRIDTAEEWYKIQQLVFDNGGCWNGGSKLQYNRLFGYLFIETDLVMLTTDSKDVFDNSTKVEIAVNDLLPSQGSEQFKPNVGEYYYYIDTDGENVIILSKVWSDSEKDRLNHYLKNCHPHNKNGNDIVQYLIRKLTE